MKKTILAAVMLAALLTAPTPGLAQEEAPTSNRQSALAENAPEPPDFALEMDGDLIVGGDVVIADCPSLAQYFEKFGEPSSDPEVHYEMNVQNETDPTRALVERCENKDAPSSAGEIPATGGVALLAFAVGTLFAGVGFIIRPGTR